MPSVQINATAIAAFAAIVVAAIGGVYLWKKFDLGVKLNPSDPNNFAAAGVQSALTSALGRDESAGTAAYEATSSLGSWWRALTGTQNTNDIDYSAPVTDAEKKLVAKSQDSASAIPGF